MSKQDYRMQIYCENCGLTFFIDIPLGTTCAGLHECIECGCKEGRALRAKPVGDILSPLEEEEV